jgi:hypothetical protein
MQHYVIEFVNYLWQITPGTPVSSTNKTDHHDITEILLKVALNTITLTLTLESFECEKKTVYRNRNVMHFNFLLKYFNSNQFNIYCYINFVEKQMKQHEGNKLYIKDMIVYNLVFRHQFILRLSKISMQLLLLDFEIYAGFTQKPFSIRFS